MPRELPPGFADVSVIMPAYRAAATIGRALASVAAQTVKPFEVVVVDDGSDDGTLAAAEAMIPAMKGVSLGLFRQSNQGPGAARNRALAEARGELIAFLDADDEWLPEKIARSLERLRSGGYALVAHDGWEVRDGIETPILGSRRHEESNCPFVTLYRYGNMDTCSVVVRRDLVAAAGGFDPTLANGQDFDLFLKILGDPERRFLIFPDRLVRYFIRPGSVSTHTARRLECQMRILRRHAPSLARFPGRPSASVAFRILAVHKEAWDAFLAQGAFREAAKVLARLPGRLLTANAGGALAPLGRAGIAGFWAWVVGAFGLYLLQFKDLADFFIRQAGRH